MVGELIIIILIPFLLIPIILIITLMHTAAFRPTITPMGGDE